MSSDRPTRLVAYAVTHDDPPQVFLADDEHVLSRLLCLRLVAATRPERLGSPDLIGIREALLDERWGDAVGQWIVATGIVVDAYPSERVYRRRADRGGRSPRAASGADL